MIKAMLKRRIQIDGARVLVMGLAFKENCPDLRNTRVVDVVRELEEYGVAVDVHDPWVDAREAERQYAISMADHLPEGLYDGVVLAVAHQQFKEMGPQKIKALGANSCVIYDLKHIMSEREADLRL